ncbi:Unknown protein sequence [Pseudomonas syringae pv. cilantro]|uniref:Uncharacterized protein n=1 Tax=Pseudomonas syringae pv. cilantro TaxID=81035 RepID=A0A0N0GCQ2_PSESX|nr:Unknown protein sequence [Pseudomonas syringae pv. cilantro]
MALKDQSRLAVAWLAPEAYLTLRPLSVIDFQLLIDVQ